MELQQLVEAVKTWGGTLVDDPQAALTNEWIRGLRGGQFINGYWYFSNRNELDYVTVDLPHSEICVNGRRVYAVTNRKRFTALLASIGVDA